MILIRHPLLELHQESLPVEVVQLIVGPGAHLAFGGNPIPSEVVAFTPSTVAYVIRDRSDEHDHPIMGAVMADVDPWNRRACVHVVILPAYRSLGVARKACVLAAAVLCEAFGVERLWTTPRVGSAGERVGLSCGLKMEGRMMEHDRVPGGRADAVVLGGRWRPDLMEHNRDILDMVEWAGRDF